MTEDNDGSELTRRKALLGMGTIGAAGAIGAGAWADYTDTVTQEVNIQAGELDLRIDGDDADTIEVAPGGTIWPNSDPKRNCSLLRNVGDVPACEVCITITNVRSKDADDGWGDGDLEEFLEFRAWLSEKGNENNSIGWFAGSTTANDRPEYESFTGLVDTKRCVVLDEDDALVGDQKYNLCFELFHNHDPGQNETQGDELYFDIDVQLRQCRAKKEPTSGCTACPDEIDSGALLAKYEWMEGTGFVFEKGADESAVTLSDVEHKEGEANEPIAVDFESDYCADVVVKAGNSTATQYSKVDEGTATGIDDHAISSVSFYCPP